MTKVERLERKINKQFLSEGMEIRNITYPLGFWKKADCFRWEGFLHQIGRPHIKSFVGSFYTITECLACGPLELVDDEFFPTTLRAPERTKT